MIEIFKSTNYNFIKYRVIAITISLVVIVSSWIAMGILGPNFAVDFTGGTLVQLKFKNAISNDELKTIRNSVAALGYGSPEVKTIGPVANNELQITIKKKEEDSKVGEEIRSALEKDYSSNPFELRRQELVGPKIGKELKTNAIIAVVLSLLALLIYVGIRFSLPFGVAAIVPIFHDVLIAMAPFFFLHKEMSLATLAALLTVAGYSLNDTIVIFDRIRENIRNNALKNKSFAEVINFSINQTLSRTVITSLTTAFVVGALLFIGGASISDFSLPMFIGTIAGVYSTIYIASPILIWWNSKWPITKV
jgi:preprotein translocase SecF subunit